MAMIAMTTSTSTSVNAGRANDLVAVVRMRMPSGSEVCVRMAVVDLRAMHVIVRVARCSHHAVIRRARRRRRTPHDTYEPDYDEVKTQHRLPSPLVYVVDGPQILQGHDAPGPMPSPAPIFYRYISPRRHYVHSNHHLP